MIIQKFGGTSVGSAERIQEVARLIQNEKPRLVVLSAMSGTTNTLTEIVNALYKGEKDVVHTIVDDLDARYARTVDAI